MTDGLTGRLAVSSLKSMRSGVVRTPHALASQLLETGRRAGLLRTWAEQLPVWIRTEIDRLWGSELLPLKEARRRRLTAEARVRAAQLATIQDGESLVTLRAEADAVALEIEQDHVHLAALQARIRVYEAAAVSAA